MGETGKCESRPNRTDDFNVLTTPWLDAMDLTGHYAQVSPLDAIAQGPNLHRLTSPNPLDSFAAHRFLLTLLYWKSGRCGGVEALRQSLLSNIIPAGLIESLSAEGDAFHLFDPDKPFLQDTNSLIAKRLPAASLFAELATGTNVAHFHHGEDKASILCLRCAAAGLLRLVPWTQSGGAGKQPSLHGAPPIVTLALGDTLTETLGLNLVPRDQPLGSPQWSGQFKPSGDAIPLLEGFTWNPRRVHLVQAGPPGLCDRCGDAARQTVGPIVYEKNPPCKQPATLTKTWQDPAVFYRADDPRTVLSSREMSAADGFDLRELYERPGKNPVPAPVCAVVEANPGHAEWMIVVPCTNHANNKSYDHRAEFIAPLGRPPPDSPRRWFNSYVWEAKDPRNICLPATRRASRGAWRFVAAASRLDDISWGVVRNAALRRLDEDPAAFDIFTGLYWPLRSGDVSVPPRAAAWLLLKLMADATARFRPVPGRIAGPAQPWLSLQAASSPAKQGVYRRVLTLDTQLEIEISSAIRRLHATSPKAFIDWPGLCQFVSDIPS